MKLYEVIDKYFKSRVISSRERKEIEEVSVEDLPKLFEHGVVICEDDKIVELPSVSPTYILVPDELLSKCRVRKALIHNHPSDVIPSIEDLVTASCKKIEKLCVVHRRDIDEFEVLCIPESEYERVAEVIIKSTLSHDVPCKMKPVRVRRGSDYFTFADIECNVEEVERKIISELRKRNIKFEHKLVLVDK